MRSFVLQDWLTIRGSSSGQAIAQSSSDFLDLEEYEDAVAWIEIREMTTASGTITVAVQSSPVKEAIFFSPNNVTAPFASSVGVTVAPIVLNDLKVTTVSGVAAMPLSRWLRWLVSSVGTSGTWDVTFRVLVVAHSYSLASA